MACGIFHNWQPRNSSNTFLAASLGFALKRRAYKIARDFDLLLSIFPFEPEWYAARVPKLRVEFVGHPLLDRYASAECGVRSVAYKNDSQAPSVVLLPGSRKRELERHLPVLPFRSL